MKEIDVLKRGIGVNLNKENKATINIWAPLAEKVEVEVRGKIEKLSLSKTEDGYWQLITDDVKDGDSYKICINDNDSIPEPTSLSQPEGIHGFSQAIRLNSFRWSDNDWNNLLLEDYLIYEVHTGAFTKEGTFAAIETKLDYLKELGITAIEIMPIAQFPGSRNWGYDGVFPFAVQNSYGGAKGLQQLVDACHQKGLAVILDVVYNHLGPEGNYLDNYGPYFTDKYQTPWGTAINFDDAWCDGVRRYFIENALMWLRDFRIDALRLDAVHAIKDFSTVHILQEIKTHTDKLMEATGRRHYLIVESDLNDTRFINSIEKGGYGMDAQWNDEFHHALRVTSGEAPKGYYSDFNGIQDLAKAYKDAYVYDGQFSPHRKKDFGVKADENEGSQFIVFSQNHDQVGNRMVGERTNSLVSFEMQKLIAASVMVSPFLPMLFMGEEWSEPNPFLYFVSHTDNVLCEAVRKGRQQEFAAFHTQGEPPDPNAEETFLSSKLQWHLKENGSHKVMLDYYKALIHLRKTHPVLKHLDRNALSVEVGKDAQTLVLHRWDQDDGINCFMNFNKDLNVLIPFPGASDFKVVLNSAEQKWYGTGASTIENDKILLKPESVLILAGKPFITNH
ncbi:MAG: malto-oligosyltrehalose trehalohydrolase [Chitinophagaceae bacterium]